jgi:hypothetical protein
LANTSKLPPLGPAGDLGPLDALARERLLAGGCRELAFQIADQFRALGAGMSLKDCVVVGGLDMQAQAKALARRPHVVIATPGRLKVCFGSRSASRKGAAQQFSAPPSLARGRTPAGDPKYCLPA